MPRFIFPVTTPPAWLLLVFALLALSLPTGCATTGESEPEATAPVPPAVTVVRRLPDLGIEVTALRLSAADTMLDFRYRVTDSRKAASLLGRKTQVYAIDAATGTRLAVPRAAKIGPLRQTAVDALEGKIYFVFFGNAGRVVKRGNLVTIVFGDSRIEGLVVE